MAETFEFAIAVDDFDVTLLPAGARVPGSPAFTAAVRDFVVDQYKEQGGWARVVIDDTARTLRVSWGPGDHVPSLLESAVGRLERGQYPEAVRTLEVLRFQSPDDPTVLYNLGMALSDLGRLPAAVGHLRRATQLAPADANAHVALGVAFLRSGRPADAAASLREGARLDPANPWAHRNLGACLMTEGKAAEAEPHCRRAVDLAPGDPAARLGLGRALLAMGRDGDADEQFVRAVDLDPHGGAGEAAKAARGALAQKVFRAKMPGGVRPDAVMYLVGALERFDALDAAGVQRVGLEVAMLGMSGLDPNDPARKYTLKSVPGEFSGLHLMCLMYAAFERLAPGRDLGFDFSGEYAAAASLHAARRQK